MPKKRKFVIFKNTVLEIKPANPLMHKSCEDCFFDMNCGRSDVVLLQYDHHCSEEAAIYVKVGKLVKPRK